MSIRKQFYEFDHVIKQTLKAGKCVVSCKVGCSACCHQQILVTTREAEILADEIRAGRVTIDRDKLSRMADRNITADEHWQLPYDERACPMLKDNRCQVYAIRPYGCRKHFSIDDPALCADPSGQQIVNSPNFEGLIVDFVRQEEEQVPNFEIKEMNRYLAELLEDTHVISSIE